MKRQPLKRTAESVRAEQLKDRHDYRNTLIAREATARESRLRKTQAALVEVERQIAVLRS